ncbi:MerR family transcriptional regulator [Janibacter indicus]|uniref:DNA-binding transcriptional regulator, MerR family n=1 Tax=Janibacter indicus TaxID=857417 RepID=A0A1W1YH04_9MICO|nr:MerR family transcriptional regulator [Janibacter indicus]SMC35412.1 DNA-binding transcriptional regulator, MerR family [Janibacter indicus]
MTDTPDLMSIGEFSSRSRLSVRMLRHYGEHGILVPADVVAASGYRRYAPEQLADAAHVRRLRDVGFTVSAISVLLAAHGTESYRQALALQRESLGDELRAAKERLAVIDQLLDQEGTAMSTITVTRTTVPARTVVALRGTVPAYDQEGRLWERLMPELGRQGLTPIGPCGVFEHDPEYREADPTLSIWLPVPPGTTAQAPLEVHELPEQEVVLARVEGPYTQISEAHARIDELVRSEGLTLAPRSGIDDDIAVLGFNRYLVDPSQAAPEDLVTEVCVPLA